MTRGEYARDGAETYGCSLYERCSLGACDKGGATVGAPTFFTSCVSWTSFCNVNRRRSVTGLAQYVRVRSVDANGAGGGTGTPRGIAGPGRGCMVGEPVVGPGDGRSVGGACGDADDCAAAGHRARRGGRCEGGVGDLGPFAAGGGCGESSESVSSSACDPSKKSALESTR